MGFTLKEGVVQEGEKELGRPRVQFDSKSKGDRIGRCTLDSFDVQEVREVGQKETGESRGFPNLRSGITEKDFSIKVKECKYQEKLKMQRRRSIPEQGSCFSKG